MLLLTGLPDAGSALTFLSPLFAQSLASLTQLDAQLIC